MYVLYIMANKHTKPKPQNLVIVVSGNDLPLQRCQDITWTNDAKTKTSGATSDEKFVIVSIFPFIS